MPDIEKTAAGQSFLPAFYYPKYRLLWFSTVFYYMGRWIETAVGAWLVLQLTNSPFLVGLLGGCRFIAMLFGPFCGTVADRINRRIILFAVLLIYGSAALIIFLLFYWSRLEVWHLFAFTIIGGIAHTFDYSTRYAIAADIVKNEHIVSAASLIMMATGITQLFGPLIGGKLLEVIGSTGCFALITISFALSFLLLLPMRITISNRPFQGSTWKNLVSGIVYVISNKTLLSFMLLAVLANLLIFPYWFTLMSVFARDILLVGAAGYGQLMASVGLGSFIGSLLISALPQSATNSKLLFVVTIVWPAILLIFSSSTHFLFSIILLTITGIAQGMSMTLIQSLILTNSSEEMRGRVSGARACAVGVLPLGNLITGYGADMFGAPMVLIIDSSIAIAITTLLAVWALKYSANK